MIQIFKQVIGSFRGKTSLLSNSLLPSTTTATKINRRRLSFYSTSSSSSSSSLSSSSSSSSWWWRYGNHRSNSNRNNWFRYALIGGGGASLAAAAVGFLQPSEATRETEFDLFGITWKAMLLKEDKFGRQYVEYHDKTFTGSENWNMMLICQTDPTYIEYYEAGRIPEVIPVLLDLIKQEVAKQPNGAWFSVVQSMPLEFTIEFFLTKPEENEPPVRCLQRILFTPDGMVGFYLQTRNQLDEHTRAEWIKSLKRLEYKPLAADAHAVVAERAAQRKANKASDEKKQQ